MATVPASSVPCKAASRWVVSMPEELGTDVFYEYGGASGNIDVHAVVGDMEPLAVVQGGKSVAKDGDEELAEGVRHRLETTQQVCWFMLITFSFSLLCQELDTRRLSHTRLHLGHSVEGGGSRRTLSGEGVVMGEKKTTNTLQPGDQRRGLEGDG